MLNRWARLAAGLCVFLCSMQAFALAQVTLTEGIYPTSLAVGDSVTVTHTITNNAKHFWLLNFSGVSGPVTLSSGTCGSILSANASCTFSVTITPTDADVAAGIIQTVQADFGGREPLLSRMVITVTSTNQALPPTNGLVRSMVADTVNNLLYIGGDFTSIGSELTGNATPFNLVTGEPLSSYPAVSGNVSTVIPDGRGGWYIGGAFTEVGLDFSHFCLRARF